ncbi:MAG TPA: type I restriction-modification enzyme R subunit C-terminal domain-containing protein, partial [Aequorivita sp.]|nr:type I restriction-modification enzyme R subunit C-terminal domain-containing protein [Aequorivita sp.]
ESAAIAIKEKEQLPSMEVAREKAKEQLAHTASITFNGELNEYLDNVRRIHEQIIDHINIDEVTKSEWNTTSVDKAKETVKDFTEYLETHKDEIKALSIFYNQPYNRREITFRMIKDVLEKLKMDKPNLAPDYVWYAYTALEDVKSQKPESELTALVSLIRRACGIDSTVTAFDKKIDDNFNKWIFKQHTGQHNRFTPEQIDWLRMLKDHIVSSFHIEVEDLDYTPFDAHGGRGKMWKLFGEEMENIIKELNTELVA